MAQAFTVDDLFLHQKITELECADGPPVAACTVRSVDRDNDGDISHLWLFALDGSDARQITQGKGDDSSPRWSPQGDRLAFISTRSGAAQVWLIERSGGDARQLGAFDGAVSTLRWAPDGQSLIVAAAVEVDPNWRGERAQGRKPAPRGPTAAEVAWKLPYKSDGMGYTLAREVHLFRLDARTGDIRQLTDGAFDVLGYDVSPDGARIAYVRTRQGRFAHRSDLWVCNIDGSGARQVTQDLAMVVEPVWSPDGALIAFTGAEQDGDAQENLWIATDPEGKVRRLGDESLIVADAETMCWTDSGRLLFSRAHRGRHQLACIDVGSGNVDVRVQGDLQFGAFGIVGSLVAYTAEHPARPGELYVCNVEGGDARQVSDLNAWWRERTPIRAEAREFDVPDGKGGTETIEGWLLRAQDARGPMPLLNDVHGGPASYALLDFDTNVFWQVLCSRGWAVLALNAVGSATYGREFCDRLQGHWGEMDLPQHEAAIRQLQQDNICDDRIAISGKSYGGYLSAWATGNGNGGLWRAAIVMAPVGNIETHYGTSDGGYYADPLYMGSPGRFDRKLARHLSPMRHLETSRTPTLFMQGKDDERCPKCQSEELFVTLSCAGDTPCELVLYPQQGHSFLGSGPPSVREDAAKRIVEWLERFVLPQRAQGADQK